MRIKGSGEILKESRSTLISGFNFEEMMHYWIEMPQSDEGKTLFRPSISILNNLKEN